MNRFKVSNSDNYTKYGTSGLIAIAFAALITLSPIAHADNDHRHCGHKDRGQNEHREYFEKRQKELHDKLVLTASQENAWNNYVAKTKPSERHNKMDWTELSKLSTPQRLDSILARAKDREQKLETRVQVTKDFYKQLSPTQQTTFDASFQHEQHNHENH